MTTSVRLADRRSVIGRRLLGSLVIAALFSSLVGCGPTMGAYWYNFGLVPNRKVPAEYHLPEGPILILIDDDQDLIQPPTAKFALVDALAKELKAHGIAERVTTNEELARVRQSEPKFDTRGAREVGRLVDADTVLWLSTKQFFVASDLEMAVTPAKFAVTVKAVNARAEKRGDVRLWPTHREGHLVSVTVSAHDVRASKTETEAHQKIAESLAVEVANLFYDRELDK